MNEAERGCEQIARGKDVQVVSVVRTTLQRRGDGRSEPLRHVEQYWSHAGELLAEHDEHKDRRLLEMVHDLVKARDENVALRRDLDAGIRREQDLRREVSNLGDQVASLRRSIAAQTQRMRRCPSLHK